MAGSRVLADKEHWRQYWSARNPVRVIDERFYYADLLDRVVGHGRYASFIELGGFPGHFCVYVKKRFGYDVTLLDSFVDQETLGALLEANGLRGNDVNVIEADLLAYEPVRTYDVVLSAGLVEHFEDVQGILAKHLEFLAADGVLLVTLPNLLGINGKLHGWFDPAALDAHNLRAMEFDFLREALRGLGLSRAEVFYFGRFRVWLEGLARRPLRVRLAVYAVQAAGLVVDLFGFRSRYTSPHIAVVARRSAADPG